MWEANHLFYITVLIQVIITLCVVPYFTKAKLISSLKPILAQQPEDVNEQLNASLQKSIKSYSRLGCIFTFLGVLIIGDAWLHGAELLRWDNQAGIVVLSFMAMFVFLYIVLSVRCFRQEFSQLASGVRQASLKVQKWHSYLPVKLVFTVLVLQILHIASIVYFMENPFDGFGGEYNFIGVALIDAIFIFSLFRQITKSNWPNGIDEAQKQISKQQGVVISLWVWAMASLYLIVSLWLSALSLRELGLFVQSLYTMIVLLVTIRFFELPSQFKK